MSKSHHRPSKSYISEMRFGVSAESPESFHLNYISILDSNAKNNAISRNDKNPGVFLSDLKKNNVLNKPKFLYEDYNNLTGFAYDTLKFNERLDLLQNDEERIRCRTPFFQKWKKQGETQEKFKIFQGIFTASANQTCNKRLFNNQIETLRKIVDKKNLSRKTPEPRLQAVSQAKTKEKKKGLSRTIYKPIELNAPEILQKEISRFENKLASVPIRKRWCYDF
jgi:hypothetical protein